MCRKITILFPIGSFYPAKSGGPSLTMYWHVNALSDKFERIVVATNNKINNQAIPINTWIKYTTYKVIFTKNLFHFFPITHILKTISELKNADIVHLTGINYPPSIVLAAIGIFYNKPIVWSIRGGLEEAALNSKKNIVKKLINWTIRNCLQKRVYFHATSQNELNQILNYLKPVSSPIMLPNYFTINNQAQIEKENYLLFLGRIHPIKNIENLIEGFINSTYAINNIQLKIAGDPKNEYGKNLMEKYFSFIQEGTIQFLGRVEDPLKSKLISKAKFLVLPSKSENFGNVVIEALSQSTPVIASQGTPWEILNSKSAGFWITNDINSLTKTFNYVYSLSLSKYESYCRNAYLLSQNYNIKTGIINWENIYEKLINE